MRLSYAAGEVEWDVLQEAWYSLLYRDPWTYEQHRWTPPWPGAPRELTSSPTSVQAAHSSTPQWVADIGLVLPPALVPGTLTSPFPGYEEYEEHEIGFHPPLQPGVNVVWAANVDMTDASLRPECPVVTRMELLNTTWVYPTLELARSDVSRADYLRLYADRPIEQGRSVVWSEEHNAPFWRATASTPYGWYTFDIEQMAMRPVDTAPDSADTINIWGDQAEDARRLGVIYYNYTLGLRLPAGVEPWPEFDPWVEIVASNDDLAVPGPYIDYDKTYFIPRSEWWAPDILVGEYMRITCE